MHISSEDLKLGAGTFLLAFLIALIAGPSVIRALRVLKFGQNVYEDAPETHQKKQGTPTMGGVLMVLSVFLTLFLVRAFGPHPGPPSAQLLAVFLVFLGHAGLGFLDDYRKTKRGKNLGLLAREKLAIQLVLAGGFVFWLFATSKPGVTTVVQYWDGKLIDLGPAYYLFAMLLMMGLSNATNLTDGLDGLASGLSILTALGLACTVLATPLGAEQLPLFASALGGACLGFLWYNAPPAKVFMGDTGSLALGASFAALALIGKVEILVLIFMVVFLMEMASVIIQVGVFKATGGKPNGRRVFKMAPIHHHFELLGWPEVNVVVRFWVLGVLALMAGLLAWPALSSWNIR